MFRLWRHRWLHPEHAPPVHAWSCYVYTAVLLLATRFTIIFDWLLSVDNLPTILFGQQTFAHPHFSPIYLSPPLAWKAARLREKSDYLIWHTLQTFMRKCLGLIVMSNNDDLCKHCWWIHWSFTYKFHYQSSLSLWESTAQTFIGTSMNVGSDMHYWCLATEKENEWHGGGIVDLSLSLRCKV